MFGRIHPVGVDALVVLLMLHGLRWPCNTVVPIVAVSSRVRVHCVRFLIVRTVAGVRFRAGTIARFIGITSGSGSRRGRRRRRTHGGGASRRSTWCSRTRRQGAARRSIILHAVIRLVVVQIVEVIIDGPRCFRFRNTFLCGFGRTSLISFARW